MDELTRGSTKVQESHQHFTDYVKETFQIYSRLFDKKAEVENIICDRVQKAMDVDLGHKDPKK